MDGAVGIVWTQYSPACSGNQGSNSEPTKRINVWLCWPFQQLEYFGEILGIQEREATGNPVFTQREKHFLVDAGGASQP